MKKKGVSAHVYITNNKIQVLTGSCVKNKLQVVNFYEEPLEEGCILNGIIMNNYSLQNTLTQMWQKNNLPTKDVTLVVNGSSITVKPLKIPQVNPKNVPGLIRAEFKDIEGVQNMLVDYSVVNPKNQDGSCSILADPADEGFEREVGQNINSIIQFNKSEQTGADITDIFLCGFPGDSVQMFPHFASNFGVTVRAFPEYQPGELGLSEGMNPGDFIVLLGSLIRYSD